jgi:hypothetical protein
MTDEFMSKWLVTVVFADTVETFETETQARKAFTEAVLRYGDYPAVYLCEIKERHIPTNRLED